MRWFDQRHQVVIGTQFKLAVAPSSVAAISISEAWSLVGGWLNVEHVGRPVDLLEIDPEEESGEQAEESGRPVPSLSEQLHSPPPQTELINRLVPHQWGEEISGCS